MGAKGAVARSKASKSVFVISLIVLALLYLRIIFLPVATTINLVPDDALFYFQVAKNFAYYDEITFDGDNPATGFHPGWMFLLFSIYKPISLVAKFQPELFYRVALSLALILLLISIALGLNWLRAHAEIPAFILPALIIVIGLKLVWNVGLESEALIALLACHLILKSRGNSMVAAIFAALVTFFRIDMVGFFFILAIFGWMVKALQGSSRAIHSASKTSDKSDRYNFPSSFWLDFAGSIVGFGLAMLFYAMVSGYPFSTSMYLKGSLFDIELASIKRNFSFFERFDWYVALASASMLFVIPSGERRRFNLICAYILSLFVWLLLHVVFNRLCAPWYFKSFRYFLTLLFFATASTAWGRRKTLVAALMVLPVLFGLKWIYMAGVGKYDGGETQVYEFSKRIKEEATLEPIFVRDYSGIMAFFSGKRVINGDGLMNTHQFIQDYLLVGLVKEYINERRIPSCIFSYQLSKYKQFVKKGAIFEEGCPFFLKCLPNGYSIPSEKFILGDCSERRKKCLVLVDCRNL